MMRLYSKLLKSQSLQKGDERLSLASALVFLTIGMFMIQLWTVTHQPQLINRLAATLTQREQKKRNNSKIYPVIIEQQIKQPKKTDQYRALSEFNAEGKGGITTQYGFHTLSNTDIFSAPSQSSNSSSAQATNSSNKQKIKKTPGDIPDNKSVSQKNKQSKQATNNSSGMHLKVPANYRFKKNMALRYDGRSLTAIATESMPGAAYFRNMIRTIRDTFAPPGLNYIHRDRYGSVISQTINPQIVKIQFTINRNGLVTDTKLISSLGQYKVDQACIKVLNNINFGTPPPEIFHHGNVFGINFIFPDMRRFR